MILISSLMVVSIYSGGKEVTSERRLIIMVNSGRLLALEKWNHEMRNDG